MTGARTRGPGWLSPGGGRALGLGLFLCLAAGLHGCSSPALDLEKLTLQKLKLTPGLTPQEVIHALGPPDEETKTQRWLFRAPRLHLKYHQKGLEFTFDSEGRTYDPVTAKLFNVYVFLSPEQNYKAFGGGLSHNIQAGWELSRLEKTLGPPQKTREVTHELEWVYREREPLQLIFIARAQDRSLKALMIIRRDRERPAK